MMILLLALMLSDAGHPTQAAFIAKAERVFIGKVLWVGDCPAAGHPYLPYQEVQFEVEEVLKGRVPDTVTVSFPKATTDCLDIALFRQSARLLVSTTRRPFEELQYVGLDVAEIDTAESKTAVATLKCNVSRRGIVLADVTISQDHQWLALTTTAGVRANVGPDFFGYIAHDEFYQILGAELSPSKQRLAVTVLQDPEFPGNRYCVIITAPCLLPEVVDSAHSQDSDNSWGARDPAWLSDDRLAFLSGSRASRASRLFIKSLSTQEYRSIPLRDVPESLRSEGKGLVVDYEGGGGDVVRLSK